MPLARNLIAVLFVSVTLISATGCGAILVGGTVAAGGYAYLNGDAKGTYSTTVDNALAATKVACKELGIPVTLVKQDDSSAEVRGKLSGDTVTIDLDQVGMDLIEIIVRVGIWGNESASRRIHNAISQRL